MEINLCGSDIHDDFLRGKNLEIDLSASIPPCAAKMYQMLWDVLIKERAQVIAGFDSNT